jgi:hypothetical protein
LRRHHCRWRAAKFRPMLGAQGLWAGRDLNCATPAVTRGLGFSGLIRRTARFSRLLRHTRGCGGSILTRIPTGLKISWRWLSGSGIHFFCSLSLFFTHTLLFCKICYILFNALLCYAKRNEWNLTTLNRPTIRINYKYIDYPNRWTFKYFFNSRRGGYVFMLTIANTCTFVYYSV